MALRLQPLKTFLTLTPVFVLGPCLGGGEGREATKKWGMASHVSMFSVQNHPIDDVLQWCVGRGGLRSRTCRLFAHSLESELQRVWILVASPRHVCLPRWGPTQGEGLGYLSLKIICGINLSEAETERHSLLSRSTWATTSSLAFISNNDTSGVLFSVDIMSFASKLKWGKQQCYLWGLHKPQHMSLWLIFCSILVRKIAEVASRYTRNMV